MLKQEITDKMKEALKSGKKLRLSTLRLLLSEIKNAEIAKRKELSELEILEVVNREIKRRKDAVEQYNRGGRQDLVDKETKEAEILQEFLPPPLTDEEIRRIIEEAVAESGAVGMREMGRVMAIVMPKVAGRADGRKVSEAVKAKLGGV